MAESAIATCNAALAARNAFFDGGSVEIRTGAAADIDVAPTGTILVTFALPNPAFAAPANRVSVMNAVTAVTAALGNAGTQVHYVAKDAATNVVGNGSAGTVGTDMILNTLTWSAGDDVEILSWASTQPK